MKDTIKMMKIQATDWEKILAKVTSYKGLLSKLNQKKLKKLNKKTIRFKSGQKFYRALTKEDMQMENKHMKRCPT